MQFTELPLSESLLEGLEVMNFKEATPVQEKAIPVILDKKDVIACAQTGTGKTAAFLLPLLNNLQTDNHDDEKVNAIIMAPTRELAQQIDLMMEGFSYYTPFSSVAVYGGNDGEAWDIQKRGLLNGADVVIATPGRLLSHINLYNIDFSGVKYFILDEADRMLDMGFHDDIMNIAKLLPKDRQTIMFSATMPPKIQKLAKSILRDPEEITIAIARPPESIIQSAYICYEPQKISILQHLFKNKKPNKVILFSGKKQKVKEIAKTLKRMGLSVGEMHSDLDQSQREHVMHEFKNERIDILVATDIVSRGIDIDDISLVINFDVPYDVEDYVHRIGRTARAGDSGMAITFVDTEEQYLFEEIEKFLEKEIYRIPVPAEFGDTPDFNPKKYRRAKGAKRSSTTRKRGDGREDERKGSDRKKNSRKKGFDQENKSYDAKKKSADTKHKESDSKKKSNSSKNKASATNIKKTDNSQVDKNRSKTDNKTQSAVEPQKQTTNKQTTKKKLIKKSDRLEQPASTPVRREPKKTEPKLTTENKVKETTKKKWKWWPFK